MKVAKFKAIIMNCNFSRHRRNEKKRTNLQLSSLHFQHPNGDQEETSMPEKEKSTRQKRLMIIERMIEPTDYATAPPDPGRLGFLKTLLLLQDGNLKTMRTLIRSRTRA